ncbi:hypothetical protein DRN74_04295 [Candidatus Micrarchaeota archaeon]|nr:MAG: hypothetical protein DRN74_04295 [Candidatus Micrarchaeota archaeon]
MRYETRLCALKFALSFGISGALAVPLLTLWGGLSLTEVFLLQTWYSVLAVAFEIPTGSIADKIGRKKSLLLGSVLSALACVVYVSYPAFAVFALGELLFAVGAALNSGAAEAFAYDYLKRTGRDMHSLGLFSKMRAASVIAHILALPLGTGIASLLPFPMSLRMPMFLTALPFSIAAIVALSMKEPELSGRGKAYLTLVRKGLTYLVRHEKLRALAIDKASISAVAFMMFWLYQAILMKYNLHIFWFGVLAAVFNIAGVIAIGILVKAEDKLGLKNTLSATSLIIGLSYIATSLGIVPIAVLGITVVISLKLGREPIFDHYMNRHIASETRATVLSAVSMLQRLLISLLYVVVGVLADMSLEGTLVVLGVAAMTLGLASRVREEKLGVENSR